MDTFPIHTDPPPLAKDQVRIILFVSKQATDEDQEAKALFEELARQLALGAQTKDTNFVLILSKVSGEETSSFGAITAPEIIDFSEIRCQGVKAIRALVDLWTEYAHRPMVA